MRRARAGIRHTPNIKNRAIQEQRRRHSSDIAPPATACAGITTLCWNTGARHSVALLRRSASVMFARRRRRARCSCAPGTADTAARALHASALNEERQKERSSRSRWQQQSEGWRQSRGALQNTKRSRLLRAAGIAVQRQRRVYSAPPSAAQRAENVSARSVERRYAAAAAVVARLLRSPAQRRARLLKAITGAAKAICCYAGATRATIYATAQQACWRARIYIRAKDASERIYYREEREEKGALWHVIYRQA